MNVTVDLIVDGKNDAHLHFGKMTLGQYDGLKKAINEQLKRRQA